MRASIRACAWLVFLFPPGSLPAQTKREQIRVDDRPREYWLHVPTAAAPPTGYPVVLVFHGGGGNARQIERETGFSTLADRDTFVVVYPQGIGNQWNDGRVVRNSRAHEEHVDEVAFVRSVLDTIARHTRIDASRVFATGISNGGFLANVLGAHLGDRLAAIAPVAGGIGQEVVPTFRPTHPVNVLIVQGTEDPLVPYAGGGVFRGRRGTTISSDSVVAIWRRVDGLTIEAHREWLPDRDTKDGCRVEVERWTDPAAPTSVIRYRMVGAGHTWPSGSQYLPRALIGRVCKDVDGSRAIWDFFRGLRRADARNPS
ncbi:MAG: PHB depolymerase family esterase [Gemmatimonadaceae bacterium]